MNMRAARGFEVALTESAAKRLAARPSVPELGGEVQALAYVEQNHVLTL